MDKTSRPPPGNKQRLPNPKDNVKGVFRNIFLAILHWNVAIFGTWFAWSNMNNPVQVEVPKMVGYFSECLIAR